MPASPEIWYSYSSWRVCAVIVVTLEIDIAYLDHFTMFGEPISVYTAFTSRCTASRGDLLHRQKPKVPVREKFRSQAADTDYNDSLSVEKCLDYSPISPLDQAYL